MQRSNHARWHRALDHRACGELQQRQPDSGAHDRALHPAADARQVYWTRHARNAALQTTTAPPRCDAQVGAARWFSYGSSADAGTAPSASAISSSSDTTGSAASAASTSPSERQRLASSRIAETCEGHTYGSSTQSTLAGVPHSAPRIAEACGEHTTYSRPAASAGGREGYDCCE